MRIGRYLSLGRGARTRMLTPKKSVLALLVVIMLITTGLL